MQATMMETFPSTLHTDSQPSRLSSSRRVSRMSKDRSYNPHILASITLTVVEE